MIKVMVLKLVFIGNSKVGKTNTIKRFKSEPFLEKYEETVGEL